MRDTTVLVYTSASRDLEQPVRDSLDELAAGVHRSDIQVVAQMGWNGQAQRRVLTDASVTPETVTAPGGVDMSQPATLTDYVRWGIEKFPAHNYVVVMGGHAAGAFGAVTDSQRSHMMQLPEIRQAIEDSGCRPRMIIFNACLMAQAETAAEFRDLTPMVVGSQTAEKGLGMPLAAWLSGTAGLDDPIRAGAELVAACALEPGRSPAVSAIQTGGTPRLEQQLQRLGQAMRSSPELRPHIQAVVASQPQFWDRAWDRPLVDEIDLGRLTRDLAADEQLPANIRDASRAIADGLNTMVVGTPLQADPLTGGHQPESGIGLSIYAPHTNWVTQPAPAGTLGSLYGRLRLPRESEWAETLSWLNDSDLKP